MLERPDPRRLLAAMLEKGTLRALDKNVSDVCAVTEKDESSFADLSEVIMRDASLSTNLLVTANSALYAGVEPVKTISAAVIRLGFTRIRALALGLSLFKQAGGNARTPDLYRMYAATYFAGSIAMELYRRQGHTSPEEGFVAGLLQQVPRLVLANTFPQPYKEAEKLMASEEISFEEACRRIFGVEYDVIRHAVLEHWHLGEEGNTAARPSEEDPTSQRRADMIREAGRLADMLFGNTSGGEAQLAAAEPRLGAILGARDFSVADLGRQTSDHDANIQRFFKLTTRDVEMMVKIVQWGRVSAAQVAAGLTLGSAQNELDEGGEAPELAIGNYLTEMMGLVRRGADVNHLLLMAQEAAFRVLRPDHVILALLDAGQSMLRGRFHAGRGEKFPPSILTADMNRRTSPIVQCLISRNAWRGEPKGEAWNLPVAVELRARHIVMAPIIAHERPIGLQFLCRTEDPPFSKQEQAWLEAITGNLGFAFERRRPS